MKLQVLKKRVYWYYRIIGSNGQVLLTSETYDSKGNTMRAARSFMKQVPRLVIQ